MADTTLATLTGIFRDVLDDPALVLAETTTAAEVDGWDSLSHVLLISAVEKKFQVRFAAAEIQRLQNIGDLMRLIHARRG